MPHIPRTSGVQVYFDTLRRVFALESEVLSGALPHYGERGANDELRVREFLSRVLPRKYSISTGFLICSNPSIPHSAQTDIIIFDEIQNSPLHRELAANVFPIEMVYGTVEIKASLRRGDLLKISKDIAKVRGLARERRYAQYSAVPKDPARPEIKVSAAIEVQTGAPPPRAFVFAFSQTGWKRAASLRLALERAASRGGSHIHGLVVLDKDWYFSQEAYADQGPRFHIKEGNALLHFVRGMLHSLSGMPMNQMSINRYFRVTDA